MNIPIKQFLITAVVLLVSFATIKVFTASTFEGKEKEQFKSNFHNNYKIFALSLPSEIDFADEKAPLNLIDVKEKMENGWTTIPPFQFFKDFYTESEINSAFNDKIKIYKLKPTSLFFDELKSNSPKIRVNRGFCRSLYLVKK